MIIQKSQLTNNSIDKIVLFRQLNNVVSYINGLPKDKEEFDTFGTVKLTNELKSECERLVKNCIHYGGIGLSANQIGINKRMFTIIQEDGSYKIYFHPSYTWGAGKTESELEGCLSVPRIQISVPRPININAEWFEFVNDELIFKEEKLTGLISRVFQHETDHLYAKSIVDYANRETKRKLLKK